MPDILAGTLVLEDHEREGWLAVEDGVVVDMGDGPPPEEPAASGWITPPLVNAHTHVADAFLRGNPKMPSSIPELVGPGGWKHRQLAMARRGRAGRGVVRYASEMQASGASHFIDFRENGILGVRFLRDLENGADWMVENQVEPLPIQPVIYGRPQLYDFDADEAEELLENVDGIGLSGMRDFPDMADMQAWAEAAHAAGKPFGVHVSEDHSDDMDAVLALDPDMAVHLTHAAAADIKHLADAGVAAVTCPRSNRFFGMKAPIQALRAAGAHICVGTDNGMLQDGDLLQEIALMMQIDPSLEVAEALRMASHNGRALLGLDAWEPRVGDPWEGVVVPGIPQPAYA